MNTLIIVLIVAVAVCMIAFTIVRNNKIRANGIEADAEISRIDTDTETDSDGHVTTTETYYVRYQNAEGAIVEAKLGNPPARCRVGSTLKVKYLPEKPKYVVAV